MERTVIQQNPTTFVISLPKKWVKSNNIKKGNKLTLEELNSRLIISTSSTKKTINLDLADISENIKRIYRIVLSDVYRKGYEQINVRIPNKNKDIITELINNNLEGFIISKEKDNYIEISNFTNPKEEHFEILLNKITIIIKEILVNPKKDPNNYIRMLEKYIQFLRRLSNIQNKDSNYNSILYTQLLITHTIDKINKHKLQEEINETTLNKIVLLYDMTYTKLYTQKTQIDKIQKLYLEIENDLINSTPKQINMFLYEILRNISIGSTYITSLNFIISDK